MRLPTRIEHELCVIENWLGKLPIQHAGTARLRGIRHAIKDYMRVNNLRWDSGEETKDANNDGTATK